MESRPLITPLCWKQKLLVPECVQAPFSWWPDTGLLQVLKGGISPDYSPAAPLLWQQRFFIFFPFCIIFVPLQPPTKRINHTTIINTAGQRVLVVGVVLAEGTSGPSPTVLQFTVNIPKTGFFNFILRYKVRCQSRLVFFWPQLPINAHCQFSGGSRPSDKGGLGHPDREIKGGAGAVSKNTFFRPFGPQFGLKIRSGGWAPWAPPLDLPLQVIT